MTHANANTERAPDLGALFKVFLKIGLLSFGGPAAQMSLMHRVLVEEKGWLEEKQYLNALAFCMLLPGPEAMQLCSYAGWRLRGTVGGLIAGSLFVLPGALVVLGLSIIYALYGAVPLLDALFTGIKATVLVIVIQALIKVSQRALDGMEHGLMAALSFIAIFFFALPFPVVVLMAGLWGALRPGKQQPETAAPDTANPSWRKTLATVCLWLVIWWLPLLIIDQVSGLDVLSAIGQFFSKLAVVSFGGAYAALTYMGQDMVNHYGWLRPGEMMDGLGLAETTPGPLILVTEFVGFLAAYRDGGLVFGIAGALIAIWATFIPCFLWIFAGAPYIEQISRQPRLKGALGGITAAVVGVILNLSIWFGLHVFFADIDMARHGLLTLHVPSVTSLEPLVLGLALLSAVLMFWRGWGIAATLGISAGIAAVFAFM